MTPFPCAVCGHLIKPGTDRDGASLKVCAARTRAVMRRAIPRVIALAREAGETIFDCTHLMDRACHDVLAEIQAEIRKARAEAEAKRKADKEAAAKKRADAKAKREADRKAKTPRRKASTTAKTA